jgi:hypothetical protein
VTENEEYIWELGYRAGFQQACVMISGGARQSQLTATYEAHRYRAQKSSRIGTQKARI